MDEGRELLGYTGVWGSARRNDIKTDEGPLSKSSSLHDQLKHEGSGTHVFRAVALSC